MKNEYFEFTTDHWTGSNNKTYTILTGHWINDLWELEYVVLDFKIFIVP